MNHTSFCQCSSFQVLVCRIDPSRIIDGLHASTRRKCDDLTFRVGHQLARGLVQAAAFKQRSVRRAVSG